VIGRTAAPRRRRRRAIALLAWLALADSRGPAQEAQPPATDSGNPACCAQHVAPQPPQHSMADMSSAEMVQMMQMDDTATTGKALLDQLEWRHTDSGSAGVWEGEAWYGGDYDKLWLRTEGETVAGTTDGRVEAFWDRLISRWWNLQSGARQDFGNGPGRTWAALGVSGLAPYWFDVEATVYAGEASRTAARVKVETDLLLTQRLIIQPEAEANLYGKPDPARQLGSGLSDLQVGLRLRYEIRRQFAPYAGVVWQRLFGGTANDALAAGTDPSQVQFVAGLRVWY
jgi:copper resistance protein B